MIEFYPEIKWAHVAAVISSGSLFVLRGAALQAGAGWPMAGPVRYFSYAIDSVLLTAGLMLWGILPGAMFANGWLTLKLLLVVVYIVLGSLALKRGRTRRARAAFFIAAAAVFLFIVTVARAHHPLGVLRGLAG